MKQIKELFYLAWWFFLTRICGKKKPLQTVLFITDRCNLRCKHCSVYNDKNPKTMSYEDVKKELEYSYKLGSRFVDFEGGEPTLWREGDKNINDLIALAKKIGFFSCTITTNAQMPFGYAKADSIWVSMDGVGEYHEAVRGQGTFEKLKNNIAAAKHKALSVNMVVNTINYKSLDDAIEFAKANPDVLSISINFHTPFPGTEHLALDQETRLAVIDKVIKYKKQGYPIMNSVSGLKRMKDNNYKKYCWVTNYVLVDGMHLTECPGKTLGICDQCGFCMAGEMYSLMHFRLDTIFSGLSLRVKE